MPTVRIAYIDARGNRQVAIVRMLEGETAGEAGQRFARLANGTFISALDPTGNPLDANTSLQRVLELNQRQTDLLAGQIGQPITGPGGVDAGPEGPAVTGLGGEGTSDALEQLPFDFEGRVPGAAFERGLRERTGRTGQPTNILRRILQGEQGPTTSVFQGRAFADLLGGAPLGDVAGRTLQAFTSGTGRVARSGIAGDILRRIGGASGADIENFLANEAFGDQPGRFLRPETTGQAGAGVDVVRDALRSIVNPLLVGALPDTNTLFNQFRADVGINPTGGQNFISDLRRRLGLERLGL